MSHVPHAREADVVCTDGEILVDSRSEAAGAEHRRRASRASEPGRGHHHSGPDRALPATCVPAPHVGGRTVHDDGSPASQAQRGAWCSKPSVRRPVTVLVTVRSHNMSSRDPEPRNSRAVRPA